MNELIEILIQKFQYTKKEAEEDIKECQNEMIERIGFGEFPFDICEEYWGLEPDYLEQIL